MQDSEVKAYIKRADKRAFLFKFLISLGFSSKRAQEICIEATKIMEK